MLQTYFETLTDATNVNDLAVCIIGSSTAYKGPIYLDNVTVMKDATVTSSYVNSTIKPTGAKYKQSITDGVLTTYDKDGQEVYTKLATQVPTVDKDATDAAKQAYAYLKAVGSTDTVIYGHQDDTFAKAGSSALSTSDTYDVTGAYAGVFGIDSLALAGQEYSAYRFNNEIVPKTGAERVPETLAGNVEVMYLCFDEPEMVHTVLEKVTEFLIQYIKEYKKVGANGVVIAEPLAGLLGPDQAEEFSAGYMRKIVEAVQDDEFSIVYHNCGNTVVKTADSIFSNGCMAYHFGNSIQLKDMLEKAPEDRLVMGNVDPAGQFLNGTVDSIYSTTTELMKECCEYKNFVISSGCDVPPLSSWDNIESFFKAVSDFYQ